MSSPWTIPADVMHPEALGSDRGRQGTQSHRRGCDHTSGRWRDLPLALKVTSGQEPRDEVLLEGGITKETESKAALPSP